MHRFHLPAEQCSAASLTLTGREAHHGLDVLRLRRGDGVVVLDGAGGVYECEVTSLSRGAICLQVTSRKQEPRSPYEITLLQAIPKGKLFENILQKATELGIFRVVPLMTERVVTRLDEDKSAGKLDHWRTIALEAIKQCGSAWLPRIDPPSTLEEFLARGEKFDLPLIASLRAGSRHPREWFMAYRSEHACPPRSLCVWVGPEGDFTDAEIAAGQSAGAKSISLGRWILRSDTAAIYCLSVMTYEMQSEAARPVESR